MKQFILFFFLSTALVCQITERYHPELTWKQFKTTHFDIVFHEGTERSAKRLAEIAEEIYLPVTKAYDYEPAKRITWIVKDVDDYSNGGAYFLDHKIEIWTEHLDYDLRGTHDWLRNVVTHEFIHMIHIQKSFSSSLNVPFALLQWIGYERERRKDVVRGFPNTLFNYPQLFFKVPAWLAEGVAQHQIKGARYDFRDTHREMVLRDRFFTDNVLSLDEMSVFGKTTIGNESSYNQGFSLVNYIIRRFGEDALRKISLENANWSALVDYNGVFERAIGVSLDDVYLDWVKEKKAYYTNEIARLKLSEHDYIQTEGEANFYPKFSPKGNFIAYLSSEGSRRFTQNKLIIYSTETKKKETHTVRISSQIEWFKDGIHLLYSKQTEPDQWGSHYNDLYVYNRLTKTETRITKNFRARNATINTKNQIVFVTTYDGTSNLVTFDLDLATKSTVLLDQKKRLFRSGNSESFWEREGWYLGNKIRFITQYEDGTQFFHPTFSDDETLVTDMSLGYLRRIEQLDLKTGVQKTLKSDASIDFRNPFIVDGKLFYSSDKSGIYNIYNQNDQPITSVYGGAFMPSIKGDSLVFSVYEKGGYKIALTTIKALRSSDLAYSRLDESAHVNVSPTKLQLNSIETERVRYNFNSYYIVPRVFVDAKRPKFGAIIVVNELLNKASAIFGASYNFKGERDIFGLFEFRNLAVLGKDPVFFIEGYNQSTQIDDRINLKFGEAGERIVADREIEFSLWQFEFGVKMKLSSWLDWRFAFINSRYHASLSPTVSNGFKVGGKTKYESFPFLRYDYHKGNGYENRFLTEVKDPSFTGDISPRLGHRFFLRASYNENKFLDGFSTNSGFLAETFKQYNFWNLMFKGSYHLPGLFKKDGLSVNVYTEGNLSEADDFYDVYAGGWVGLKGYPYFSMHGKHLVHGSMYYTNVLGSDLMLNSGFGYIKNIAVSSFVETGDAWTSGSINLKSDVGFQIKADTYGPLKLMFEGAYPLDVHYGKQRSSEEGKQFIPVKYPKEWRFYFMLSYDFGLQDIL